MQRLGRIAERLRRIEEALAIALVIAIAVILNLQVICRYVLSSPLIWPEEIARLGLIWLSYIAVAAVTARGGHIAVDMFLLRLGAATRRRVEIALALLLAAVFATLAILAWRLARSLAGMEMAATELPIALLVLPLVIGGGLSAGHALIRAALIWSRAAASVAP